MAAPWGVEFDDDVLCLVEDDGLKVCVGDVDNGFRGLLDLEVIARLLAEPLGKAVGGAVAGVINRGGGTLGEKFNGRITADSKARAQIIMSIRIDLSDNSIG